MNRKTLLETILWSMVGLAIALIVVVAFKAEAAGGLRVRAVCRGVWEVTNSSGSSSVFAWRIVRLSSGSGLREATGVDSGHVRVGARSSVRFSTPYGYMEINRGDWGGAGSTTTIPPSNDECEDGEGEVRTCENLFKYTTNWPAGTEFHVYNIGAAFLETYAPSDLGYELPTVPVSYFGEVYLLLCQSDWPANQNFVGFINGVKVIEFTLGERWPEVTIVWSAL